MSVLLALLTALILISMRFLHVKDNRLRQVPVLAKRYLHPAHTWMRPTEDGEMVVGVDEFAQTVVGAVDAVMLPRLLKYVRQGEVAWHVRHGNREVPMVSPVTGWVIERNDMVRNNPKLINEAPLGDGWVIKVHARNVPVQLRNLFSGRRMHALQEMSRVQLRRLFSDSRFLVYQDGGELVRDFSDRCSDEDWDKVVREVFLSDHAMHEE